MELGRRRQPRQHRRDWRRLWRYCRCGWRWRCPDSIELVPKPYQPPLPLVHRDCWDTPRSTVIELTEVEAEEIRALWDAPPSVPVRNRRPGWDAPTHTHLNNGRAGALTPAQQYRSRRRERV